MPLFFCFGIIIYCTAYFNRILVINTIGPLLALFYTAKKTQFPYLLKDLFSQAIFQVQGRNYISVTFLFIDLA
jgi:hypothetical protein